MPPHCPSSPSDQSSGSPSRRRDRALAQLPVDSRRLRPTPPPAPSDLVSILSPSPAPSLLSGQSESDLRPNGNPFKGSDSHQTETALATRSPRRKAAP